MGEAGRMIPAGLTELLFAVLYDTGMRVGEALGLRHEHIAAAEREVRGRRGWLPSAAPDPSGPRR